ncbi:arpin isoform X2 [Heterodontus francisci]|uniref:arpin isoform X2 n=1 Tax=Heterodontus francisci TaxID=7792 RepID=UPI00355C01C1
MSRIYDNKTLKNKPVFPERLAGLWDPVVLQRGPGVVLEGKLQQLSRHQIIDSGKSSNRYFILYIQPTQIHKRKFDSAGMEIEPNFSETKKVNTGYLMSSFKVEAKGQTDKISVEELKKLIDKAELVRISEKHTPDRSLAFWISEGEMENIELEIGDGLRLKTNGDSPFICEKVQGCLKSSQPSDGERKKGSSTVEQSVV